MRVTQKFLVYLIILICFQQTSFTQSTFKSVYRTVGGIEDAVRTPDGGFVSLGSSGAFEIIKINESGELLWTTSISNDDFTHARNIAVNIKGDIFFSGLININGVTSMVLFKLNKQGVYQNSKRFFHSSTNSSWDLHSDGNEGVFLVGGGCNGDNFFIHCDENLDVISQRGYSVLLAATAKSIEPLSNGNFILGGNAFDPETGSRPIQIFEINPAGELVWSKVFESYSNTWMQKVIELKNGDLAVMFLTKPDPNLGTHIYISRHTADGTPIWTKGLNHEWDTADDLIELEDGGIMIVGHNRIVGDGDAMIAKLSSKGDLVFLRNIPGQTWNSVGAQNISKILPICEDKFAVFGFIDGMVIAFVNEKGEGFCESSLVSNDEMKVNNVELETLDLFVTQSPLSFEQSTIDVEVNYDVLIENNYCNHADPNDTTCLSSSIEYVSSSNSFNIYPSPVSDRIFLQHSFQNIENIQILNNVGRTFLNLNSNQSMIDVDSLIPGIYFVKIVSQNKYYIQKFIKQ